ncbi:hypothetical protein HPB51_018711 [Rhipicephalus microplus]|uniref:Uncharacterized protein n=1 Tax=Rhipicephalus microplus TaxID=6941 RepID=A0A9J6DJ11_RHIMP|nr:hypothetical protein HPB51_018711 [Rhipicephalus microplus]
MDAAVNQVDRQETNAAPNSDVKANDTHELAVTAKSRSSEKVLSKDDDELSLTEMKMAAADASKSVFVIGTSVTLLVVIVLSMMFVFLDRARVFPLQERSSFCCEMEARQVIAALNTTLDPCDDFYQHVCMRATDIQSTYVSPMFKVAIYWKEVEMMGPGGTPAGLLISALRPTAAPGELMEETNVTNFTKAILSLFGQALRSQASASTVVEILAELSVVYRIPAIVSFGFSTKEIEVSGTALVLERHTSCFSKGGPGPSAQKALHVFNKQVKTEVTSEQLATFAKKLASKSSKQAQLKRIVKHVESSPFQGLSQHQWVDILKRFVYPVHPEVKYLTMLLEDGLSEIVDELAKRDNQPASLAYAVICAARTASMDVTDAIFDYQSRVSLCLPNKLHLCALEDIAKAQMVSNPMDDALFLEMMTRVRDTVVRDALKSHIFRGRDRELVTTELGRLKLMLPKETTGASNAALPNRVQSKNLALTILRGRSYVFNITRSKVERGIPSRDFLSEVKVKRRNDVLYVPTNLYVQLRFLTLEKNFLALPMVGVSMASEMWSFLLESEIWSNDTQGNIASFYACFRNSYFGSGNDDGMATDMAHTALGLVSAQNSADKLGWQSSLRIDSTDMTQQQLFYYLFTYNQCSLVPMEKPGPVLNVALRNDPEFRQTFRCESSSRMSQRVRCMT